MKLRNVKVELVSCLLPYETRKLNVVFNIVFVEKKNRVQRHPQHF